ncbi:hypothetical protein KUF71_020338 [Frankliniella fusca]|nr:hypothetical protein KUF71_020338 [Frankliniella fusca]
MPRSFNPPALARRAKTLAKAIQLSVQPRTRTTRVQMVDILVWLMLSIQAVLKWVNIEVAPPLLCHVCPVCDNADKDKYLVIQENSPCPTPGCGFAPKFPLIIPPKTNTETIAKLNEEMDAVRRGAQERMAMDALHRSVSWPRPLTAARPPQPARQAPQPPPPVPTASRQSGDSAGRQVRLLPARQAAAAARSDAPVTVPAVRLLRLPGMAPAAGTVHGGYFVSINPHERDPPPSPASSSSSSSQASYQEGAVPPPPTPVADNSALEPLFEAVSIALAAEQMVRDDSSRGSSPMLLADSDSDMQSAEDEPVQERPPSAGAASTFSFRSAKTWAS